MTDPKTTWHGMKLETVEWLMRHGYAPGDYFIVCHRCGDAACCADKRARICLDCAIDLEVEAARVQGYAAGQKDKADD